MTLKDIFDKYGSGVEVFNEHESCVYRIVGTAFSGKSLVLEMRLSVSKTYNGQLHLFSNEHTAFKRYTPPKKKVKMWKWAYKVQIGGVKRWTTTKYFYSDVEHISKEMGKLSAEFVKIENSMIEVEK